MSVGVVDGVEGKPAQLAWVVVPASHPYEKGGGTQRLVFIVHERLR